MYLLQGTILRVVGLVGDPNGYAPQLIGEKLVIVY